VLAAFIIITVMMGGDKYLWYLCSLINFRGIYYRCFNHMELGPPWEADDRRISQKFPRFMGSEV
jgi:hypothetical protein